MPKVIFITHEGRRHEVQAELGRSLMIAAVDNAIKGIDADCGGQCACATCHVYVQPPWDQQLPPPSATEKDMLSFTAEAAPNSRLSCQIRMTAALDGIELRLPESQH